jgi:hypothetical protein
MKKNPNYNRNLPLGSASVATRAEVPKYRINTRHVFQLRAEPVVTGTVTNPDQASLPVGSQFADAIFAYNLKSFYESSSGLLAVYDQYRIRWIEIYAEQAYEGPGIDLNKTIYASVDHDDINLPNWLEIQSRENVSMTCIRNNNPKQVVARFKPVANFVNAAGDSPSNIIPNSNAWFDVAANTQDFNGLKVHFEAPGGSTTSLRFSAKACIEFRGKI